MARFQRTRGGRAPWAALAWDRPGRRAAAVAAGLALLALAYRALVDFGPQYGFSKGVEYWLFRPTDSSPVVILALALWLLFRRRDRIRSLRATSVGSLRLAALPFALGCLVYAWAVHTAARDLQLVSLVIECAALVALCWGTAGLRALWLPIVFPLFAVPMPAPLLLAVVFKLQLWTASYAGWLLHLLGVPALVSGDQILRVSENFQVIEGCSGMRSIQTLSILTILLIDLFRRSGWPALLLFTIAPALAFALNGFRVLTLILNPHSEIVAVHNLQGLVILLVGLLIIYAIDGQLERFGGERGSQRQAHSSALESPVRVTGRLVVLAPLVLASLLLLIERLTPVWQEPGSRPTPLYSLVDDALRQWPSRKVEEDFFFRGSARFGSVVHRSYSLDGGPVSIFLGMADLGQRGGSPLSRVTEIPGSGWTVRSRSPVSLEPGRLQVAELLLERGRRRALALHWFQGARGLVRETLRSLLALDRSELRRVEPLFVVRLDTPTLESGGTAGIEAARVRLLRVYEALRPVLRAIEASAVDSLDPALFAPVDSPV